MVSPDPSPEPALGEQMGIDDHAIARRLAYVGYTAADQARVEAIAPIVEQHADEFATRFFEFLRPLPEAAGLFATPARLETARRLKRAHLCAMARGVYDRHYVAERLELGLLYARAGLDLRVFLGAFHDLMHAVGNRVMAAGEPPAEAFERFMSFKKVAFFDLSLIVDTIVFERERTIAQQKEAIRELSTPVLKVRDRLLLAPIVGAVDAARARQLTDELLASVRRNRARCVVLDITGVPMVDTVVAGHLIQTIRAARLMGATTVITGVSTAVASSLVSLGVDVDAFDTVGDLQRGLEEAEALVVE